MINTVAHLADIHIKNDLNTHKEYKSQFDKLYSELRILKPDRIVVVGDITHDFLSCSYEVEILAVDFIVNLTKIASTIVVEGNHCIRKTDLKRASALKNFVSTIKKANPNINLTHYNHSGFFDDDNIVWVNHSHLEKTINPWNDIKHQRDINKTYIDLFHDPINGCSNDSGYKFESKRLRKISDFKGDIGMFGDIHKFQYLNKEKTIAFSSSLIQQNFGESPDTHGFMIWDINKKTGDLIELQTEYTKLNFYIEPGFDYNDIPFNHTLMTNKSFIKVHWKDISANINDSNEEKIDKHFKNLGIINEIQYEEKRIYTDISESEILTENIDINNETIQQQIFKDYLVLNGYDEEMIQEVLKIDDEVNSRLEDLTSNTQTNWKIDRFWLDNFKSYEKIDVDWSNMNGIIQLYSEENQQGKTTLLDGICYITHGTTLSTNKLGGAKTQKHGDSRYINNKKDLDFCSGGLIMSINKKKYAIVRKTERTWTKGKKSVNGAKTTVAYYKDGIIDDEHLLTGESKTETQSMLDKLIVDFVDFIRLTLINSFNINELIAMDRATFIDSIIKDAGYDIFEKKLEIFKSYKKELTTEKITIELTESEDELIVLKNQMTIYKKNYDILKDKIENNKKIIKDKSELRDIIIKKLTKIDDDILNLDIDDIDSKITINKNDIETGESTIKINDTKMKSLQSTYDEDEYDSLLKELKSSEDTLSTLKMKIGQLDSRNETLDVKLEATEEKITNVVSNKVNLNKQKIKDINLEIDNLKNSFNQKIEKKKQDLNLDIKELNYDIKTTKQKLSLIKDNGVSLKIEIKDLEEAKVCPTCFRAFEDDDSEHLEAIEEKKSKLKQQIIDLMPDVKKNQDLIKNYELKIENIENQIIDIDVENYTPDLVEIEKILDFNVMENLNKIGKLNLENENINDNKYSSELLDEIKKLTDFKEKINIEIIKNKDIEIVGRTKIKDENSKIYDLEKSIQLLKVEKDEVTMYNSLKLSNDKLEVSIEKINNAIGYLDLSIKKYNSAKISIEQNKILNLDIEEIDGELLTLESFIDTINDDINELMTNSSATKTLAKDLKNKITKYKEQQKRDNLLKIYLKCVHRDGIPFYLLMKSRDLINQELSDILSPVNFNIFFDDKMNLKMSMESSKNIEQLILEGSGAEKSFSAIALKMALRSINNNSRPNFLMLDEVTGNLKGKSVDNFNIMLEKMKEKVDKVIIIEQNHPINYDFGFEIKKDEQTGISSLKIK